MRRTAWVLVLLVVGCQSEPRYVGVGDVVEVDAARRQAIIRHDRIDGLLDPNTTQFAVPEDAVREVLAPGARVRFEVRRLGDRWTLTRANLLSKGNPGLHDHTPHHGGVVAMAGMLHLEATAAADGRVQLYLTDVWRRPLPLDDVRGSVMLDLPEGKRELALAAVDGVLTAQGPPLNRPALNATFALRHAERDVEVHFLLPLGAADSGAAGVPVDGCGPVAGGAAPGSPRCMLRFAKPIAALALSPSADALLVAQVDYGISAWRLPAGSFALGFAPAPAVAVAVAEAPHAEAPNALLVRPDGQEAVVATENRLVFYAMRDGKVLRAFAGPGGIVRAAAWAPDGSAVLVTLFYDATAYLLDAADGRVRQRLPIEREGAAVAISADGRSAAVASEAGPVALFDLSARQPPPPRMLNGARGAVRALAFVGDELAAAGDDGRLRIWGRSDGALRRELQLGRTVYALAVNPALKLAASAGMEPHIKLIDLASASPIGTLDWGAGQILSLAWTDKTLAAGDGAGSVALWTMPDGQTASPP